MRTAFDLSPSRGLLQIFQQTPEILCGRSEKHVTGIKLEISIQARHDVSPFVGFKKRSTAGDRYGTDCRCFRYRTRPWQLAKRPCIEACVNFMNSSITAVILILFSIIIQNYKTVVKWLMELTWTLNSANNFNEKFYTFSLMENVFCYQQ